MKFPRKFALGLFLVGIALAAASCGGIVNPQGWASPTVEGTNAYYLQSKDHLAALTFPSSGNPSATWTFPDKNKSDQKNLKLQAIYGTPAVDGDTVYDASYGGGTSGGGAVFAVNKADGTLRWIRSDLKGSVIGSPALANDLLAVGTVDKQLYLLNKKDGSAAPGWPKGGISINGGIWAQPVIKGSNLYVATMNGDVFALKLADGSPAWDNPFHISGAIADLAALDDSHLFVPSLNKQVYIVNISDGTSPNGGFKASDWVWTRPAYKDGIVYFGDFSGSIYALDITKNTQVWKFTVPNKQKVKAAPAIVQDTVVAADEKTLVHFIDARTGVPRDSKVLDSNAGKVRADIVAMPDGNAALISTTNGKLYKADPKDQSLTAVTIGGAQ